MTRVSRRNFLKQLYRHKPTPKSSPEAQSSPPSMVTALQTDEASRAWQKRQGQGAVDGELPAVVSWLSDYIDDQDEPELPRAAKTSPWLRPPGAIDETTFLFKCTRCGDCQTACPHGAIRPATKPPAASGFPWIDPSETPCRLCDDLPCVTACETGALTLNAGHQMGIAQVNQFDCLNTMGAQCTICREQCPIEDAILFANNIPMISRELCVGCGMCHYSCPSPTNAVAIMPCGSRNSPPLTKET